MSRVRAVGAWLAGRIDRRDVLGGAGLVLVVVGGETLLPGVGTAAAGLIMVAIAVLVR